MSTATSAEGLSDAEAVDESLAGFESEAADDTIAVLLIGLGDVYEAGTE